MSAVTVKLIAKELHLNRWLIAVAIAGGGLSLLLATTGRLGFSIGALTWLTTIVACGVILPMYGIQQERKDRSLLFALSLPISPTDYVRAKMLGMLLCFLVLWLVLSAGAVVLVVATASVPDGLLPYVILLSGFLLANFACVMCGALLVTSESAMGAVIIVTNMGITLFMILIGRIPAITKHMLGTTPVWSEAAFTVLACEAAVLGVALTLPLIVTSRRRDFV